MTPKLNIFSTALSSSLLARKTTKSFSKIKFDLGIITASFLIIAPILISSGKLDSLIFLLINSDLSEIFASVIHIHHLIKNMQCQLNLDEHVP